MQLENATVVPPPALTSRSNNELYEYNQKGTDAIKKALMETGAVALSYCADTSQPGEIGSGEYFNYKTWSQYTNVNKGPNHGVTIVGRDENYDI